MLCSSDVIVIYCFGVFSILFLFLVVGNFNNIINKMVKLSSGVNCCLAAFPSVVNLCLLKICRGSEPLRVCKNT